MLPTRPDIPQEIEVFGAFFDIVGTGSALIASGWDVEEEIQGLVKIARTAAKESDKMAAMRQIRSIVREVAEMNGLVTKSRIDVQQQLDDGEVHFTEMTSRLIDLVRKEQFDSRAGSWSFCHEPVVESHRLPSANGNGQPDQEVDEGARTPEAAGPPPDGSPRSPGPPHTGSPPPVA